MDTRLRDTAHNDPAASMPSSFERREARSPAPLTKDAPMPGPFTCHVRTLMSEGAVDQPDVARALGMSVATLRRRLSGEGTSFRSIRTEALSAKAFELLATELPLSPIAERLGFSDVRSFSRAFKAWTGDTPNTARRRIRWT